MAKDLKFIGEVVGYTFEMEFKELSAIYLDSTQTLLFAPYPNIQFLSITFHFPRENVILSTPKSENHTSNSPA